MDFVSLFCIMALGYLLGSIPFGLLLTKYAGMGDIRDIGSGNIGATNVLRTGNKKLAALTLLLDGLKGTLAVIIAGYLSPEIDYVAGFAALIGHIFPVWLKFKGGKGVATFVGVMLALAPADGFIVILTWLLVAQLSRFSSLAAVVSIALAPATLFVFGEGDLFWVVFIMSLLVIWKHKGNIRRLIKRTEPKIGVTKHGPPRPQ